MASISYVVTARDSTATPPGTKLTGLTPGWVFLKALADGTDVAQPAIAEVGQGQYKFSYDAEATGEASGQVDMGATVTAPADRFVDVVLTRDSGRIQAGIAADGTVRPDLTVVVPATGNAANTLGDCLNAARAGGFGGAALDVAARTLTLFAPDGTTPVRVFTLDSGTQPLVRT